MKKLMGVLAIVVFLIGCTDLNKNPVDGNGDDLDNNPIGGNGNEPDGNGDGPDLGISDGYSILFCNEEVTIKTMLIDTSSRNVVADDMTYSIEKKGKGLISSGTASLSADGKTLSFSSGKGNKFRASFRKDEGEKAALRFSSSIPTDTNTSVSIQDEIEEATIFVTDGDTEFAYLLHIGLHAFEIGFENEDGIITFLQLKGIRAPSNEDFAQMIVSLGSHQYLFYQCQFDNDTVNVSSIRVINWVPPYEQITADISYVAGGWKEDTKGILDGAILFNGVYEEKTIQITNINRLSMMGSEDGFIYESAVNTEYPYLLWGGGGYFKLGKKNGNVISFLPIFVIGATSHDGQIIHQPKSEENIFVAFDFSDYTYKKVNVFISERILGSHHYLDFRSITNELDTHILNGTALEHYSFYEYTLIDYPVSWTE